MRLREILSRPPQDPGGGWDAVRSANDVARQGRPDAESVELLRAQYRPEALLWAADLLERMGKGDIYRSRSASRLRRAAGAESVWKVDLSPSVPDLPSMSLEQAFAEVSSRVPAVTGLEAQARRIAGSPQFERVPSELGEDLLLHPSPQSALALRPLLRRARKLVGPRAGSDDPVVATAEAAWVVQRRLLAILEQDPAPNGPG